jgi:hypothetical protein
LLPLFSICESAGGKNLNRGNQNTNQRFLPPELPQIENKGNKTQNKDFYHQNSHKLRTMFALSFGYLRSQFMRVLEVKMFVLYFCYLCSQFVRVLEVKIFGLCFGYLRSQFMRVLEVKIFVLCFGYL